MMRRMVETGFYMFTFGKYGAGFILANFKAL